MLSRAVSVCSASTQKGSGSRVELAKVSVEKFTAIVTLQTLHKDMKLSKEKRKETLQVVHVSDLARRGKVQE